MNDKICDKKWYAIFVAQGKEFFVKDRIENLVEIKDDIDEVLVPTIKEVSENRRKKIVKNIIVYPSYVFLNCRLTSAIKAFIIEIAFVIKFLESNRQPTPIRDEEMDVVRVVSGDNKIRCSFQYKIGDMIEIFGGHCKGLSGRVIDIPDVNSLKVEIQIFNRAIYTLIKLEDVKAA